VFEHETRMFLGRTSAGTLRLREDNDGVDRRGLPAGVPWIGEFCPLCNQTPDVHQPSNSPPPSIIGSVVARVLRSAPRG
jgi:hypothetical protein